MKNLRELLDHEIKDLYAAEKQLLDVMPKIIEEAKHKKLKKKLTKQLKETEIHLERIQKICQKLEINPGNTKCDAMEGIIKECVGFMEGDSAPNVLDIGLIAYARRMAHYKIAGYDSAYRYAKNLSLKKVRKLLKKTRKEEQKREKKLKKLAKKNIASETKN